MTTVQPLPALSPEVLTTPGTFVVGCNYWASHAGTGMWAEWRADVVAEDLRQLASAGVQVLRIFPLWPDFQPLTLLRGAQGHPVEFRHGEEPLADDDAGRAGVSVAAMAHFSAFLDLAEAQGLRVIVGLVTGWMSGRLFVPPGLEGRNPLTDPVSLMWQVRFVQYLVRQCRAHPAILAWDLGNECNVMGAATREQAWTWAASIVNAIRAEDRTRPVVSGMHSLTPGNGAAWTMQDQGELTDVLTTHPYPYFTPHCDQDPVNTMRTVLHSTAESCWYADIGGAPCLVEEVGTLGPMLASERIAADFVRNACFSAWAHDCHGLLWWCAYDQLHLAHAPYDWGACERELGLIRGDRDEKPVLAALTDFGRFVRGLPIATLPPRLTEAVCLSSEGQDQWGVAYASFVLAKQAGFDLTFQHVDQPLRDAPLYLLPCVSGNRALPRRRWLELLARVEAGASLYISYHDGLLSPFNEPLGVEVQTRQRRTGRETITLGALPDAPVLTTNGPIALTLAATTAEVLGMEADGHPAFTSAAYGAGTISFLAFPLELEFTHTPGACQAADMTGAWHVYDYLTRDLRVGRAVRKSQPQLGVTEHPLDADHRVIVLINYAPTPLDAAITLHPGWTVDAVWRGCDLTVQDAAGCCPLGANDAAVFTVKRGGGE